MITQDQYAKQAAETAEILKRHSERLAEIARFLSNSKAATEFSTETIKALNTAIACMPGVLDSMRRMRVTSVNRGKTWSDDFKKSLTNGTASPQWRNILDNAAG